MFRRWGLVAVWVFIAGASSPVVGQSPFVANMLGTENPNEMVFQASATSFTDIPFTQVEVTVPAGTATLSWTLATTVTGGYVRPVIGNRAPTGQVYWDTGYPSGTWSTPIEGGTHSVRLQVACHPQAQTPCFAGKSNGFSMTLVVFPGAAAGVPAVGGVGLAVMVVVLAAAGGIVMVKQRRPAATGG